MSRRFSWCLAILVFANVVPTASACPGMMLIGLPLVFGPDDPASSDPKTTSEEAQEPPSRAERAQESLKVWRQLVREARFEEAAVVAAKAASLDPTNVDCQQAVFVSQTLRTIGEKRPAPVVVSEPAEIALRHLFPQGVLSQNQPSDSTEKKIQRMREALKKMSPRSLENKFGESVVPVERCLDGSEELTEIVNEYERLLRQSQVRIDPTAEKSLQHFFPKGLLACENNKADACPGCPSASPQTVPLEIVNLKKVAAPKVDSASPMSVEVKGLPTVERCCTKNAAVANAESSPSKRVSIVTAKWQIECDRIVRANDQEIVVEGDVRVVMAQSNMRLYGSRMQLNMTNGTIQTELK